MTEFTIRFKSEIKGLELIPQSRKYFRQHVIRLGTELALRAYNEMVDDMDEHNAIDVFNKTWIESNGEDFGDEYVQAYCDRVLIPYSRKHYGVIPDLFGRPKYHIRLNYEDYGVDAMTLKPGKNGECGTGLVHLLLEKAAEN